MADITQITHPEYSAHVEQWQKYRYVYEGGETFKEEYLKKFTKRETEIDFATRKAMTYTPCFAKAAMIEIKNAIFSRMADVKRIGGTASYQEVIDGTNPGVDRGNSSMNAFIGGRVLPELLSMGKVGVFIDRLNLEEKTGTRHDDMDRVPYLYIYTAEQIKTWSYDKNQKLSTLLVEATVPTLNEELELIDDEETEYRLFKLLEGNGVEVTLYDADGEEKDKRIYPWTDIPCTIIEIPHSLLTDVADYQISHLNIASSDVNYAWQANFPFYTEQQNPYDGARLRTANPENTTDDGTSDKAGTGENKEIQVGVVKGRSYAKGLDAPSFIHPSPEPLEVSMKKQDEMKREIRQLVQLAVTNMDPRRESAESKTLDERGLEAGLSYIAQELERLEREISRLWSMYEQSEQIAQVKYPEDYSLKSSAQRVEEAAKYMEMAKNNPSHLYQKEMMKLAAETTLGNCIEHAQMVKIKQEIDKANVVFVDPEMLVDQVEHSIASAETVASILGYETGEAGKAEEERVRRASEIVSAQAKVKDAGARGVPELEPDSEAAKREKQLSQARETNPENKKGVRGDS